MSLGVGSKCTIHDTPCSDTALVGVGKEPMVAIHVARGEWYPWIPVTSIKTEGSFEVAKFRLVSNCDHVGPRESQTRVTALKVCTLQPSTQNESAYV